MGSSQSIMERLSQQFASVNPTGDKPDYLTRYMGGHNRTNMPYISGYWQLFINVPPKIFGDQRKEVEEWIHVTADGYTPPNRTINRVDLPGLGGTGSSFPTGQTITRSFTITYTEYQHLPLLQIHQRWTSIFDPYVGVSPLKGSEWIPSSFKGNAFIIKTKPVGGMNGNIQQAIDESMIEQVEFFHGVWPEMANEDAFGTDIMTNDRAQLSITYSFDGWPLNKSDRNVVRQALTHLNAYAYQPATYDKYIDMMNIDQAVGPNSASPSTVAAGIAALNADQ